MKYIVTTQGCDASTSVEAELTDDQALAVQEKVVTLVQDDAGYPLVEVATDSGHRRLVGAGRSELARCLLGLHPVTGGQIVLDGTPVRIRNMEEALHRYRIGYVTEDRKEEGLLFEMPIRHSVAVTVWRRLSRGIRGVSQRAENDVTSRYVDQLDIRVASNQQLVGTLSGGNQQKVSLAKWLAADTQLLIMDEPTVGVDVRTKADFHELILDLAIVLISSDLPEMIALADRISVMKEYRIVGTVDNNKDYPKMSVQIMDAIRETVHTVA